jgi:bifunctional DNase/RNase
VLLVDEADTMVLPIFVGGTEAMSIKLRMEGKKYKRPLTHDLLGDVMHDLGGSAFKVQVDELKDETYIGSAFIEKPDGTVVELDARPSDCIALALGEKVPIYVRKRVFDIAGVPKTDFDDDAKGSGHKRGDPLSL